MRFKKYKRVNKNISVGISSSRGDSYEIYINNLLNKLGWHSRRTGGTIIGFPDVIATNNITSTLLAIEAKASSYDSYYVDVDQILRCFRLCEMFAVYEHKYVILAFKFLTKRRVVEQIDQGILSENGNLTLYPKRSRYMKTKRILMKRRYYEVRDIKYYYFIANDLRDTLMHPTIAYARVICDYYGKLLLIPKSMEHTKTMLDLPRAILNKHELLLPDQCQRIIT